MKKVFFGLAFSGVLFLTGCLSLEEACYTRSGPPKDYCISKKTLRNSKISQIENVDKETFEILGPHTNFSKDKNHVYYNNNIVEGADPLTFHSFKDGDRTLWKDKNAVYENGKKIKGMDVSIETLNMYYKKDKNAVYIDHLSSEQKIEEADPETFEVFVKGDDSPIATLSMTVEVYGKDKNHVYYKGEIIQEADPKTFTPLGSYYAKDKDFVYCHNEKFENIDRGSFQVFLSGSNRAPYGDSVEWGKDKNFVYYNGQIVPGAHVKTFQVKREFIQGVGGFYFIGKDKNDTYEAGIALKNAKDNDFIQLNERYKKNNYSVYYFDRQIFGANPRSFQVINKYYGKDEKNVYRGLDKLKNVDPESFQYITEKYIKDKKTVYWVPDVLTITPIEKADSESFEVLNDFYTKDKNAVYFKGKPIPDATPQSFIAFYLDVAKDQNHVYHEDQKIPGLDAPTYEFLDKNPEFLTGDYYSRDKNGVYWKAKKIPEADLETFERFTSNDDFAIDKNGVYKRGVFIPRINLNRRYIKAGDIIIFANKYFLDADADTFIALTNEYGKDKNHVFWRSEVIEEADLETFEAFGTYGRYGKDKDNVYYFGQKVDPKTFGQLNHAFPKDKNNIYDNGDILKDVDYNIENEDLENVVPPPSIKETPKNESPISLGEKKEKNLVTCNDGGRGICQVKPLTLDKNGTEGPGYERYKRVCWGYDGGNCEQQHGDEYVLCKGYQGHVTGPSSLDKKYYWFTMCEKPKDSDDIIHSPKASSPVIPPIVTKPKILPQTCDLQCDIYHYGNCPKGCIQRCVSSGCSGNICTSDCNGPGSCACP